jgi:undecaprenyl-diphosphatase
MDQAIRQWISSFAGRDDLLDFLMITVTRIGVPLLIVLVVAQWWSTIDRDTSGTPAWLPDFPF